MAQPGREGPFEIWNAICLLIDIWLPGAPYLGAWVTEPSAAEAMRTMAFRPDAKNPALLDAYCCQRVPFVVTFHPDGSLTSYSEMLPGVSDDPASPHFGDQMRLASQKELRPDYFYLRDLEKNTESRIDIVVTGASPPMAKPR